MYLGTVCSVVVTTVVTVQVRETVATLTADYKARYGSEHPAKTDEEFVASLKSLRWLFDVQWAPESGTLLACVCRPLDTPFSRWHASTCVNRTKRLARQHPNCCRAALVPQIVSGPSLLLCVVHRRHALQLQSTA